MLGTFPEAFSQVRLPKDRLGLLRRRRLHRDRALRKYHIWEVATWTLPLGKNALGKYLTSIYYPVYVDVNIYDMWMFPWIYERRWISNFLSENKSYFTGVKYNFSQVLHMIGGPNSREQLISRIKFFFSILFSNHFIQCYYLLIL